MRRDLTKISLVELNILMENVVEKMLEDSCPCQYNTFFELVTLNHNDFDAGAVYCFDTNYLISAAIRHPNYLQEYDRITENCLGDYAFDILYKCTKCSSIFHSVNCQYSINFMFKYFKLVDRKVGSLINEVLSYPFPLFQGFYGYDDQEIAKCSGKFILSTRDDVFNYLTQQNPSLSF